VTIRTKKGRLCQINTSRRAAYGYDQRFEVLGSAGMLQCGNHGRPRWWPTRPPASPATRPSHSSWSATGLPGPPGGRPLCAAGRCANAWKTSSSFAKYLGGSSANIAFGVARLGLRAAMVSRVGDEQMGRFLTETLQREGCDTSAGADRPAAPHRLVRCSA
jgi:hypothetical protein